MKEILGTIGRFFENHVEKVVFSVIGVVCAYLLFTRVVFSPNKVLVGDKKYSPSAIDKQILEQAQDLDELINSPDPMPPNVPDGSPLTTKFMGLLACSVPDLAAAPGAVVVVRNPAGQNLGAKYELPRIGPVTDVAADHIRAVAYVPVEQLTAETPYDKAANEPNDIDLVTVEAKIDTAALSARYHSKFAGADVREEAWRDPCLARSVFAAVQLQRQVRLDDGGWSDWQHVPRSRTEHRRQLFRIIERPKSFITETSFSGARKNRCLGGSR